MPIICTWVTAEGYLVYFLIYQKTTKESLPDAVSIYTLYIVSCHKCVCVNGRTCVVSIRRVDVICLKHHIIIRPYKKVIGWLYVCSVTMLSENR